MKIIVPSVGSWTKSESPSAGGTTPKRSRSPTTAATLAQMGRAPRLRLRCPSDPPFFLRRPLCPTTCPTMSATVRLSAPTSLTTATFSQASFLVLVLIPEEREPNKMLFLASTSEISTSTSHSLKFSFLPFSIISFLQTSALLQVYLY